ncbi:MAG: ATP-dependent DNA helicase [Ferruginibacter sp.]
MQSYREKLEQKFKEEYERLNENQRKAVDTIEGPVMVIAGPGTGKTQILAARIGKILLDTDAVPENILCLTYTDAGSIAMRRRLVTFIGADAYKVHIHTFHSFCNDVIQDNLSLFDKHSLDAISELENIQLFKKLIDDFPKNHALKRYRGDVYYEINNLRNLFSSMKREGWPPAFINQKIDEYLTDLPNREDSVYKNSRAGKWNKGELKPSYYDEKDRIEKLRSATNEFDKYQELMRKKNRYDFDDMINWVIKVFEENENVLSSYQERYQYILVDEFQDTSGTQNRLVQLLISYWDKPNVFVVGDDDQSIFRFQGANVENMLDFAKTYTEELMTVVLTNNYRSTQPILDISKTLISKNEERLIRQMEGLTKELLSSHEEIKLLTHTPIINEYSNVKAEMADITYKISDLLTHVAPGNIAVIYRENKYGEELAKYMRLKNIPVYSKRSINILQHPFAKKIINLLRYLDAEHDIPYGGDEMLFEILHFDFYTIPPIEIAKLTVEVNNKKYSGELTSIRRLLNDKINMPPATLFDKGLDEKLKNITNQLEQLIADVSNVTLQQLFENIIQKGGVLQYILKSSDKIALMQILTTLFDFIKEETSRDPALSLNGLINIIELMEKEELPIRMDQVGGTDNGVNLLTAHGSKGLEYEYVFFAGLTATSWEKKKNPPGGFKLPDTMFTSLPKSREIEELRRLFYVGLTRAQKHLYLSYAANKNDGKPLERSMFIDEIQDEHNYLVAKKTTTDDQFAEFELLQFTAQLPEIQKNEEDFITNLLMKFEMNVTALNNYLKCPLGFYYKNLIRIPSGKNEATEFGSAIHFALEKFFRKMQDGKTDTFPSKEELINEFKWYIHRHRENFTKEAFDRRVEYGESVLEKYYEKYINSWNTIVAVERNIKGVVVNSVPLKGKLDKLEFTGKEVNVVDYKTGDVDKAISKMQPPGEKEPNGGDYWRQAVFYKILVDNYGLKDWKVISTEFDFIEPDKKKNYRKEKIIIDPADTETVKQQILTVWEKIQNRDFYIGCGKEDCHWCNFVKDNKMAVALHEPDEEN